MRYAPHDPNRIIQAPAWTKPRKRSLSPDAPSTLAHSYKPSTPPKRPIGPDKSDRGPALTGLGPTAYKRLMVIAHKAAPDLEGF